MLISEAINRVQSAYSKGMPSDDSRLSNRHIYSKLRSTRITIISQTVNKKQMISQWCYQPVVVKMTSVSKLDCPELVSETCKVLKSTKPIPAIFTSINRHLIQSVTSLDGSKNYGETNWETIRHNQKGRKYANSLSEFYIKNGYLYVTEKQVQTMILLTACFNDPIAAKAYSDSCGKDSKVCSSYLDYDFAVDGKMEDVIIAITNDDLVEDFRRSSDDRKNNGVDDAGGQQTRRQPNNRNQDQNYE